MTERRLLELLDGFGRARVAVVGDFFLDKWLLIDRKLDEPSIETGLTAYQVTGKRLCPGAAGTITNNLSALGALELFAVGAVGDDGEGFELLEGLRSTRVKTDFLIKSNDIFTPTYIKPLFDYPGVPEETHRLDIRNRGALKCELEEGILANLREAAKRVDAIVVLDQVVERNTGVATDALREALTDIAKERPGLILYADSRSFAGNYRNCIVKCNHHEALCAAGLPSDSDLEGIMKSAQYLAKAGGRGAFVTCGERGIVAAKVGEAAIVPTIKAEGPIDIVGAGDSVNAALALSLCAGATFEEAAFIANIVASITIEQIGTTGTASREAVAERFRKRYVER